MQQSRPKKDIKNEENFNSSTSQQKKRKRQEERNPIVSVQVYYKMEDEKLKNFELLVIQANIDFLWSH